MALDRLGELQIGEDSGFKSRNGFGLDAGDIEMGTATSNIKGQSPDIAKFWNRVSISQDKLKKVEQNLELKEEKKADYKSAVSNKKEATLLKEFDEIDSLNSKIFKDVSEAIKELDRELQFDKASSNSNPEDIRIKQAQLSTLTTKLNAVLSKAQSLNEEFEKSVKSKLKRQINTVNDGSLTQAQIDTAVENNDTEVLQGLIQQKLLGKASMQLEYAVRDIDEKCRGIEILERNVREIYEMIKEIGEIVKAQGEQVDRIGNNVSQARDFIEKGNKQLVQGKKEHGKARKKQCYIIIIGLVILVVVLTPTLGAIIAALK